MASPSLLSLGLCFLVILHGCAAQRYVKPPRYTTRRYEQDECAIERLNAQEPSRQIRSEAGLTEIWDENDDQFRCAGVAAIRHTIDTRGLLVPSYSNAPKLFYVVQGRGIQGTAFPGCPETYQSSEAGAGQSQHATKERRQSIRDEHQKIRQIREGDIVAVPAGVADWYYNSGQSPLVLVAIIDTSNYANQLDENYRKFFLSGSPKLQLQGQRQYQESQRQGQQGQEKGQEGQSGNVFDGFDDQTLAEAYNVDEKLVKQMKSERDSRGIIVRVEKDLQVITSQESKEQEEFESRQGSSGDNDVEMSRDVNYCHARLKLNINDPLRADFYSPRAGRLTIVNSLNLPILRYLRLSAEKVVLYRDALATPKWNTNAHSICYITRGSGRVQIVNDNGKTVFDGQVQEGQIITAPQNYVVVKKAGSEGLEWVAFKTHDRAKSSQLAGRVSTLRGLPEEVISNAYSVSREEARRIKYSRDEVALLSPGSRSEYGGQA